MLLLLFQPLGRTLLIAGLVAIVLLIRPMHCYWLCDCTQLLAAVSHRFNLALCED